MPPIKIQATFPNTIPNKSPAFSGTTEIYALKSSNKLTDDADLDDQLNFHKTSKYYSSCSEENSEDFEFNETDTDEISSDDNSEFEYVSYSDDDVDTESVDDSESYENITPDHNSDALLQEKIPFWFNNETEDHVKVILEIFSEKFITKNEFSRSSQPFVGCVKRYIKTCCSGLFQTFDQISIKNNQKMEANKPMCDIREVYCFTTWDNDGLPSDFFQLDFHGQKESICDSSFVYSSSLECKEVTYANLPWNFAPYSPFFKSKQVTFPSPSLVGAFDKYL